MAKNILGVTILEHRNISVGKFHDKVLDTPDPYFIVECSWLKKKQEYRTVTKKNRPTADVNETFQFVIPDDKLNAEQPVEIKIYDDDKINEDDKVEEVTFDASCIKLGQSIRKSFKIEKDRGEFDVEFRKNTQEQPDFRLSEEICDEEQEFLKSRVPKVKTALEKCIGFQIPDMTQTPIISVTGSGGGYRAVIGMSGGMAALKDAGLLEALTYTSGLSGSSWYLCSAYAHDGMRRETMDEYHKRLKSNMTQDGCKRFFQPGCLNKFRGEDMSLKEAYDQPSGLANYFGHVVGEMLLGDQKMDKKLSELGGEHLESAEVPFPILTSVHAKNKLPAHEFHVHIENTPYEISMPRHGINVPTKYFGSHWDEGIVTRQCPEFPLHYYVGSCGCAFSVLLGSLVEHGSEENPQFVHLIDDLRHHKPMSVTMEIAAEKRARVRGPIQRQQSSVEDDVHSLLPSGFLALFRKMDFCKDRSHWIKRTAEVRNVLHNFDSIPDHYPKKRRPRSEFEREILRRIGTRTKDAQRISTEEESLAILDAGVVKNVSVECFLRPSRRSDIIIVFDMNQYASDEHFDYMPILQSAEHAWRDGLPFPPINIDELVNAPPKEFLLFEGDADDCPTVLWFTLCNKNFRELKNYKPNVPYDDTVNGRPFNDFPVFGNGSKYSTFQLGNTDVEFEQLHQLMYHNVSTHVEDIKKQIFKVIERKANRPYHHS